MKRHLVVFLCVILIYTSRVETKWSRIRGGDNASINEFKYIVAIRLFSSNSLICAGTIVTNRHVLTAAHCICTVPNIQTNLWIIAGSTTLSGSQGVSYYVRRSYTHPEFEGLSVGTQPRHNDITVLAIRGTIEFTPEIGPIELTTTNVPANRYVTMCGWGATVYPIQGFSDVLKKVRVKVLPHNLCPVPTGEDQICTYTEGKGAIFGDSGGPVVRNGKLVAIISYGFPWIAGSADRHTNIFEHLEFINSVIQP